jgi:hypothetical protein
MNIVYIIMILEGLKDCENAEQQSAISSYFTDSI